MKKLWREIRHRIRQPRWRHGRLATLWMAVLLAILVIVNIVFSSLEDEYGWRKDFSFNSYATTGEETAKALDTLTEEVELYLLYRSGEEDTQLLQLLNRYAVLSDKITVIETDIARNPGILTRFQGDVDTTPDADNVIVHCPATGQYKLLTYSDFITQSYSVEEGTFSLSGLAYEKKLTEAIVTVSKGSLPVIGLVQGHGEFELADLSLLQEFLESNSYQLKEITLTEENLTGVSLLFFAAPQKDLSEAELTLLSDYAKAGGSFMITRDYTDPLDTMPNYLSFLRSYGVKPLSGIAVAAEEDTGSYFSERIALLPYMAQWDMTYPLTSAGMDILLMPAASAFETPGEDTSTLTCGTLLQSGEHAYVRNFSDGVDTVEKQPGDIEGPLSLALYAERSHSSGDRSRMLALGSTSMLTYEYIYQRTYTEEFILLMLGELIPESTVSLDIMASAAVRPALTVGSQTFGTALIVALPVLILAAAFLILWPRSRR